MADLLFIAGLVVTGIGVVLVLIGFFKSVEKPPQTGPEGFGEDVGAAVEAVRKLLEAVEKQFRIGVLVMIVGLTLVGIGAYVKGHEAEDDSGGESAGVALSSGPDAGA